MAQIKISSEKVTGACASRINAITLFNDSAANHAIQRNKTDLDKTVIKLTELKELAEYITRDRCEYVDHKASGDPDPEIWIDHKEYQLLKSFL